MWPFTQTKRARRPRVRRGSERLETNLLSTDFGDVVDISGDGMRVRAGRRRTAVGEEHPVTLRWDGCRLTVKCRVAWVARAGDGKTAAGFVFEGASPRLRAMLDHLGRFGFVPGSDAEPAGPARADDAAPRRRGKPLSDYYQILGLDTGATAAEVRGAYYRLAQQYHPDASRDPGAPRVFQSLAEAYRTLRDPETRQRYDSSREAAAGAAVG
jgi:hypothetical protein